MKEKTVTPFAYKLAGLAQDLVSAHARTSALLESGHADPADLLEELLDRIEHLAATAFERPPAATPSTTTD